MTRSTPPRPPETAIGAGNSAFPSTVWDVLSRLGRTGGDANDINALAERYWRPVYKFIRVLWRKPVEDAKDLTQEFFATVFDEEFLKSVDRGKGNFRAFLKTALRNFLSDSHRASKTQKRGGGQVVFSLDPGPEEESIDPAVPEGDSEQAFDQMWAAEILRRALERLEEAYRIGGKAVRFEVFKRYCLEEGEPRSYKEVAAELGLADHDVRNHLVAARQDLRGFCSQLIQETVPNPGDIEEEMTLLFGRRP